MGRLEPFLLEQWMDNHEITAKYNIAETCCASISINELCELSESKQTKPSDLIDTSLVQTYGEIRGSSPLRENLARLYSSKSSTPLPPSNVLITPGAIAANLLVFYSLLEPGDHVVVHYPTYQQLYSVPRHLGADVDLWKCSPKRKWIPDIDDLKELLKPNTKMIVLNSPQNPTGAVLPKSLLKEVMGLAEEKGIIVLSDEVYRPLFHGIDPMDKDFPPSALSTGYKKVIVTGSMSKAYSLAGIRVGWVASRSTELVEAVASARDYTTISVSQLDQQVAAFALSPDCLHSLLACNIKLAKTNLALLDRFVLKHDEYCSWVKPVAGTTAFVKFERGGRPIDAVAFCTALQERTGVMLLPGDLGFGPEFKGYVRIGYVNKTDVLKEALEELSMFMRKEYDDLPLSN